MARQYEGQVRVLGVPAEDTPDEMRAFVERHGLQASRQVVDLDREVWRAFGVPGQPAWAFVSADGDVRTHIGALSREGLVEALEALVAG